MPRSLGTLLSVLDALFDIRIEAEVIADGTGTRAGTTFSGTRWTWPSAGPQRKEKLPIERFVGKFIWRSTIQIQTVYARPEDANRVSCYGRGTTLEDVQARDITLGFHESCHRADFVSYLSANSLPAPPKLRVGMTWEEYDTVKQSFTAAVEAYFKAMEQYSQSKTDEVGHAKSDWLASGRTKCFLHILP